MESIFTLEEFKILGFEQLNPGELDQGGYYNWWRKMFGDINLDITYEYDKTSKITNAYAELCGEKLKPNISREEILQLGRILNQ